MNFSEYPVSIELEYDHDTKNVICSISFNQNAVIGYVDFSMYATSSEIDGYIYNGSGNTINKLSFNLDKREYVVSVKSKDNLYIGSLLVYPPSDPIGNDEVLYDLFMNCMYVINPQINLSVYSNLNSEEIDDFTLNTEKQMSNIILSENTQILYEECIADEMTYYFDVENGGYSNIQFISQNPNEEYIIEVYYNVKYYNEKLDNILIKRFEINGSKYDMGVLLIGGQKIIKIIRKNPNSISLSNNAYAVIINQLKWGNLESNYGINTVTYPLPVSGSPLLYDNYVESLWNDSYSRQYYNCYNYALNLRYNTSYLFFSVPEAPYPGEIYNYSRDQMLIYPEDWAISESNYLYCLTKDAQAEDNSEYTGALKFLGATAYSTCPIGEYKIAIVYSLNDIGDMIDFHFYRQNQSGTWSHKKGMAINPYDQGGKASEKDANGDVINDPYFCNRGEYTQFLWFRRVANPSV